MTSAHSTWPASGFEALMLCPGKKILEAGKKDSSSVYASEGTAAHQLLTWALDQNKDASFYLGQAIGINEKGRVIPVGSDENPEWTFEIDDDMARHVQVTIDYARDLAGDDGLILVDQRVNYSSYLGVPEADAWGTLDIAILRGDEVIGVDLKYGMCVVVSAERNPQISLYVLGILAAVQGLAGDFTKARLAISQPRVKTAPSEYDTTVAALEDWARDEAQTAIIRCNNAIEMFTNHGSLHEKHLNPGEKQCKFCKAKATCPALRW